MKWLYEHSISLILVVTLALSLLYIAYLRWRMAASKARFSLSVLTSILICILTYINFLSGSVFYHVFSVFAVALNRAVGAEIIPEVPPGPPILYGVAGGIAVLVGIIAIWRFGTNAILSWEGPATVLVNELAKQHRDNSLVYLAFAEALRKTTGSPDPPVNAAIVKWEQKTAEVPLTPRWDMLSRSLLLGAFKEISISEREWKDRIGAWSGTIFTSRGAKTGKGIFLLPLLTVPNDNDLKIFIETALKEGYSVISTRVFVVCNVEFSYKAVRNVLGVDFEIVSKRTLFQENLNLDVYARDLIRRFDEEKLGGTDATLLTTYKDTHVVAIGGDQSRHSFKDVYSSWLQDGSRRHLAIVGEYGQGKSTAMLAVCVEWARRYLEGGALDERVPLLVELRNQSPAGADPVSFLAPWATRFGLDPRLLFSLIQSGMAIAIFEGFDELKDAGRAYDRHEQFNALWRLAYPGTKIIFTGRPNFFIDEREKNRTLRIDAMRGAAGNAYTQAWMISKLKKSEVYAALLGFNASAAPSIIKAAQTYPHFREIISRPSMLPVIATIWPDIERLQMEGHQLTSAVLIERYLDASYKRKEVEIENYQRATGGPLAANYLGLPRRIREMFSEIIVWTMVSENARNTISRSRFDRIVAEYLPRIVAAYKADGTDPSAAVEMRNLEAKHQDIPPSEWVEMISNEIASAGLFVSDPAGGVGNLCLPHKQYYEFIIAKTAHACAYDDIVLSKVLGDSAVKGNVIAKNLFEEPNSINYFGELIGDDFKWFRAMNTRLVVITGILALSAAAIIRRCTISPSGRRNNSANVVQLVIDRMELTVDMGMLLQLVRLLGLLLVTVATLAALVSQRNFNASEVVQQVSVAMVLSATLAYMFYALVKNMPKAYVLEAIMRNRVFGRLTYPKRDHFRIKWRLRCLHAAWLVIR